MQTTFWNERWEQGEIGFHQTNINPYLGYYYGEKGPDRQQRESLRVFVPLCGKSLDMGWLAENGYSVVGVECSPVAVHNFFEENKLEYEILPQGEHVKYKTHQLEVLLGDYFQLQPDDLGSVTDIFDRASLIALPENMRADYVKKITELQKSGTRTLLITLTYLQHEMDGPPFSVTEEEVYTLYEKNFKIEKLCQKDVLSAEPRFKQKGLTSLKETAYKLTRN